MAEEHPLKPFYSVLVLAFACSALVALAAVGLRPYQEANQALDKKKNILAAAGIYEQGVDVEAQFASIETRLVDLDNGAFVQDTAIDPDTYDQLAASMRADTGAELGKDEDLAGIKRREKYSLVYLVKDGEKVDQLVLPALGDVEDVGQLLAQLAGRGRQRGDGVAHQRPRQHGQQQARSHRGARVSQPRRGADLCRDRGFRFSPRLHIELWGDRRGT